MDFFDLEVTQDEADKFLFDLDMLRNSGETVVGFVFNLDGYEIKTANDTASIDNSWGDD